MRRQEREKLVILGATGALLAVIVVVTAIIVLRENERRRLEEEWRRAQGAVVAAPAEAVDPFAARDEDAINRVRGVPVSDGTTVGGRVDAGALATRVDALRRAGVQPAGWRASRVAEHSIYAVSYVYVFHAVEFGPRWYVQMDPDGPSPPGSGGVVPVNGLAQQLHKVDLEDGLRYLNRAQEVLVALTEHRFDGGQRLGSALLVFFEGRGAGSARRIIGWHVVPEATDPAHDLLYRAYFQWEEEGAPKDAWWEVNLTQRDFRAKDLQANEIMAMTREGAAGTPVDIRPRTLDLTVAPADEPDPKRRAFRHLLANERLVEAVSTLLGNRAGAGSFEYQGWNLEVTSERHIYELVCRFAQGGTEGTAGWRVDSETGASEPVGEIATTARLVLEQVDAPAP